LKSSFAPILCIVGARPNFMKIAPIMAAFGSPGSVVPARLVHTGQHYDTDEVGSGTHAAQTAEIMRRFEPVVDRERPSAVLVVGDVNSTIACALVAAKKGVPVIHVEAGLRSFDRTMPEEINRVLTDQLSELLFTTERAAHDNLAREGVDASRIHFVGNVMIDTLRMHLPRATPAAKVFDRAPRPAVFRDSTAGYGLLTLHRPSNVDDPGVLKALLTVIRDISEQLPIVFPVHPRTTARIRDANLDDLLKTDRIFATTPLGYLDMLGLMAGAKIVLTDSGGIQEETTSLGIPCVTLRDNTERPITVDQGTNTVVGRDTVKLRSIVRDVLQTGGKAGRVPEYWDGQAAQRIKAVLLQWLKRDTDAAAAS
jgi:UDP-N-acetylglucosamine 2-epimerase (non-hydrolysing)